MRPAHAVNGAARLEASFTGPPTGLARVIFMCNFRLSSKIAVKPLLLQKKKKSQRTIGAISGKQEHVAWRNLILCLLRICVVYPAAAAEDSTGVSISDEGQ